MTVQTKRYIELSDMAALRCECKHCGTSLCIAIDSNAADSLKRCPKCRKGWTVLENTNHEVDINNFVAAAIHLQGLIGVMGFNLSIEIKPTLEG